MKYEEPKISVLLFNARDIITASDDEIIGGGGLGGGDLGDGGGTDVNGSRTAF